eukprot:8583586-Pyramimonas_sp.AAC.1
MRQHLPAGCSARCARCAAPMRELSVVVADADQAYEQCAAGRVGAAWAALGREVERRLGVDSCLVKRSRQQRTK